MGHISLGETAEHTYIIEPWTNGHDASLGGHIPCRFGSDRAIGPVVSV